MPIVITRNELTKVNADAIVNTTNTYLLSNALLDEAIHLAAGPALLAEYRKLGDCNIGQAVITKAYNLPAKYVMHTVGPDWHDDKGNAEELLRDFILNSLLLAKEYNLESIAFPLKSIGAFGIPKNKVTKTAISVIRDFLIDYEMTVFLVVHDEASIVLPMKLFSSITDYINDNYIEEYPEKSNKRSYNRKMKNEEQIMYSYMITPPDENRRSLEDLVKHLDDTFSQMLLRLIDEKGMTDVETYKKANVDRKLFSKIRNDIHYKPSKPTAIAFAIALGLNLDEAKDLLLRAGFALTHSSQFDIIIEYFIELGNYNIYEINEALFAFKQNLLGA